MARPLTHHLAKNFPNPQVGFMASPPLPRSRVELFATLLSPLHYEPDYAYPLVIWLDTITRVSPTRGQVKTNSLAPNPADENDSPSLNAACESENERRPAEHTAGLDFQTQGLNKSKSNATQPLSLSAAMNEISLRNFAAISARGFENQQASIGTGDTLTHLVQTAKAKLNIHPDRIFLVVRSSSFRPVTDLMASSTAKLAGVVWIAAETSGPEHRLSDSLEWDKGAITCRSCAPLFMAIPDSPEAIDRSVTRAKTLHSLGWEPMVVASAAGSTFTRAALANANRWMMGIVTGQPTLFAAPVPQPLPKVLEN